VNPGGQRQVYNSALFFADRADPVSAAPAPLETLAPAAEDEVEVRHSNTFLRLKKKLERSVGEAIGDYNMIGDGDTANVAPVNFRIVAMNLDQKQPGFPDHILPAYFESIGVEYRIVTEDTYSIVKDKIPEGKTTCSLCSRLRRGIIYRTAKEIGATRIALGHHRDDILETLFLNMFFGGKIKAMPPKLVSDDGNHVVIRPLAYCTEADIARFARAMDFPIIPCNLCGSQENAQRKQIKAMLQSWSREFPGRIESLATSLKNIVPSHLADPRLFDFVGLTQQTKVEEGDTAFDPVELPKPAAQAVQFLSSLDIDRQ